MRRLLACLIGLTLAVPASASNQTRAPEVLLVVCNPASGTEFGNSLKGMVDPLLKAYGMKVTTYTVTGTEGTPGKSIRNFGVRGFMDDEWGRTRDFDGVIFLGQDWKFVATNLRTDSLTFAPTYATVPVLAVGTRGGWVTATPDSTGATPLTSLINGVSTAASITGTPYQFGVPVGSGESVALVSSSYPGVTKIVESTSGGDTTYVWRRNITGFGSITFVNTMNGGNNTLKNQYPLLLLGMESFVSQLPDSVRPRNVFSLALHIDDGCKRDDSSANGGAQPDQVATIYQYADSLDSRGIKHTLGMECSTDTMNVVDANGSTRWVNDFNNWNSPYCKFTPHVHAGVSSGTTAGNDGLDGHFADLFGGARNRDCDPTATQDTTLYWNCKVALDTLTARCGSSGKVDHVVMPPTDDYSPLNVNSSTCNLADMLSCYRRAGFVGIRIATQDANLANATSGDPGGYYSQPGYYPTAYGDIALIALNFDGYLPGLSASSQTAETTAQRAQWPSDTFSGFFAGQLGLNQASVGNSGRVFAFSNVMVNHVRNYGGAAPGWQVARDVDSIMRGVNYVAGQTRWQWVWSEQLNPKAPDGP